MSIDNTLLVEILCVKKMKKSLRRYLNESRFPYIWRHLKMTSRSLFAALSAVVLLGTAVPSFAEGTAPAAATPAAPAAAAPATPAPAADDKKADAGDHHKHHKHHRHHKKDAEGDATKADK